VADLQIGAFPTSALNLRDFRATHSSLCVEPCAERLDGPPRRTQKTTWRDLVTTV